MHCITSVNALKYLNNYGNECYNKMKMYDTIFITMNYYSITWVSPISPPCGKYAITNFSDQWEAN